MKRRAKALTFAMALAIVAPGCTVIGGALGSGATTAPSSTTAPPTETSVASPTTTLPASATTVAQSPDDVAAALGASGLVETVSDAAATGLRFTSAQLDVMANEVAGGSGILGADLDAVAPMPDGAPPFSYLIAAWLHDAPTERARLAHGWYPADTDWTHAPDVAYPRAVLLLFVLDVAEDVASQVPPLPDDQTFVVPATALTPDPSTPDTVAGLRASPVGAACGLISDFFTNQFTQLFNLLRLRPDFLGGGVLGFVGGIVAALWNTAVDLAGQVVQGLVRNLGQPVLEAIGKAIAIAGIVSHVSTYLTGWNLQVQSSPGDLPFAVGTGPEHAGMFAVSEASGYRPWQPDLVRCAQSFGIELPEVLAPGSPVRWEVQGNVGSDGTTPLIVERSRDDVVPPSGRPQFRFVTGREDSDEGGLLIDAVTVHVRLSHDELRRVLDLGKRLINSTIDGLVGTALPVPALAEQVRPLIHGLVDPLVRQLDAAITNGTRSVFELHAQDRVIVYHHGPPDPTTTIPPPETAPPDPRAAFCAKLDELYPLAAPLMDWAATGVAGIAAVEQLTPLAPAELQDEMATMMAMYQAASQVSGAFPDQAVLAVAESFANAAITVTEYCGFDPSVMAQSGMVRPSDN